MKVTKKTKSLIHDIITYIIVGIIVYFLILYTK